LQSLWAGLVSARHKKAYTTLVTKAGATRQATLKSTPRANDVYDTMLSSTGLSAGEENRNA
jgi:hypothetical protein